jgi:predicted nucleic acid-binding protein
MPATFLDTSAIVKLVLHEPESNALVDFLDGQLSVEASELSIAEVGRAVRRIDPDFDEAEALDALALHRVTGDVLRRAARLQPTGLRTLDAIHLATALSHGDGDTQMVTYDERLAAAARAHGLRVVQPGR